MIRSTLDLSGAEDWRWPTEIQTWSTVAVNVSSGSIQLTCSRSRSGFQGQLSVSCQAIFPKRKELN
eukprot:1527869-Rhodomonas_salina.6